MIEQIITPTTHDLGQFDVRRAIPARERTMVGPFIFIDQFGPRQLETETGVDVRPHPHISLSTVTWLFEGALDHRDSLGSFMTVRPRQLGLMTAGRGIVHSERTPHSERPKGPHFFGMQTWLALPDGKEEMEPAFEAFTDLPVVEDTCAKAMVIMGKLWGRQAPSTTHAETIYAEIQLAPGGCLPIETEADERAVILVEGEADLDDTRLGLYNLTVLAPGAEMVLSSEHGGRVMLMGGEAFTTRRHVWWNFVSSDRDRIRQAREDWREGRFPQVPGDEEEFISLPDQPKTISNPEASR